jgi:hypothetical protein
MVGLLSLYETDVSLAKDFDSGGRGVNRRIYMCVYVCVCVCVYIYIYIYIYIKRKVTNFPNISKLYRTNFSCHKQPDSMIYIFNFEVMIVLVVNIY